MTDERTARKIVCNAVFKGGGAKGIAYAGALKACEEHIEWNAVAGSSAGAITATMVACDIPATKVEEMMPTALKTIGNPYAALFRPGRASLLDSTRLHAWLRTTISHAILGTKEPVRECTFKEIYDETGISLYVVTLDLATRQPIVFGPDPQLTPGSHVAPAVVASSAIPVAFPAARMVVDDHVHRVVDGGTWSNYPAFVFLDDEFRRSAGLAPTELPTIGFVLDEKGDHPRAPETSPTEVPRPSLIGDKGSSAEAFGIFGAVVSSSIFRWAVGLMPVLFVLLSVYWLGQELRSATSIIEQWVPREFQDLAVVSSVAILAVTGLAAIVVTILILRLGKTLFDVGLVGASAAMGVGPSVAYWVGTANREADTHDAGTARPATNHVAVRIQLDDELKTLSFGAKPAVRQRALEAGSHAAATELHRAFGVGKVDESDEHDEPVDEGESTKKEATWRRLWRVVWPPFGLVVALAVGTASSFEVVNGMAAGAIGRTLFGMAAAGVSVVAGIWMLAKMRQAEITSDSPYPLLSRLRYSWLATAVSVLAALLFVSLILGTAEETGDLSYFEATRAPRLTGTVELVIPDEGDLSIVGISVTAEDQVDTFYDLAFEAEEDPEFDDLVGGVVVVEFSDFEFDSDTSVDEFESNELLIEFPTLGAFEVGETVEIGVDLDDDRVFLLEDRDVDLESEGNTTGFILVALVMLVISFRSMRASKWIRQQARSA